MKPKTKRKLKWVADSFRAQDGYYVWFWPLIQMWEANCPNGIYSNRSQHKTKRQAIAACEKYFREKGRK